MSTHTPGPWSVWTESNGAHQFIEQKTSRVDSVLIAELAPAHEANADFIVRACNAHEALLAELKTVRDWINQLVYFQPDEAADAVTNNGEDIMQRIDDLLDKVEGRA